MFRATLLAPQQHHVSLALGEHLAGGGTADRLAHGTTRTGADRRNAAHTSLLIALSCPVAL